MPHEYYTIGFQRQSAHESAASFLVTKHVSVKST